MKQILIAIDQLANAVIGGWADETLSSRAWREDRHRLVAAVDVSDQPPTDALDRLGLRLSAEPETI